MATFFNITRDSAIWHLVLMNTVLYWFVGEVQVELPVFIQTHT